MGNGNGGRHRIIAIQNGRSDWPGRGARVDAGWQPRQEMMVYLTRMVLGMARNEQTQCSWKKRKRQDFLMNWTGEGVSRTQNWPEGPFSHWKRKT